MAGMLEVPTLQLSHPIFFFVLVETDDAAFHHIIPEDKPAVADARAAKYSCLPAAFHELRTKAPIEDRR
jgi:hypothetical protein